MRAQGLATGKPEKVTYQGLHSGRRPKINGHINGSMGQG